MTSLYDRLGGEAAIMAAVDLFYGKVLADPLTAPFFAGLDMGKQTTKQVAFMSWAFGGPDEFKGRDLATAHASLIQRGLSDAHFDAVTTHLATTLREMGVEDALVQEVLATVGPTRDAVLGRA